MLYCHDMEVLVKYEGKEIAFPTFGELEKLNPDIYEQYTYLFSIDQMRFYLTEHLTYDAAGNFQMIHKEQFRHAKPRHLHLQELRDSSFIIGIKAENTVANAENR